MMNQKNLTSKQRNAVKLKEAHGQLVALTVGIGNYDKLSGFPPLKTCSNDAIQVCDAFHDVWQLNADKGRICAFTSKSNPPPSKGEIIKSINRLISLTGPNDRLLFYYSGHGHRLRDASGLEKFYIVPQDAYSETEPEALIDFGKIQEYVNSSEAKQKIIIIDACMSGPDITGKKLIPKHSIKSLAEYMRNTKGIAIISSSTADQISTTQSPNPELSLFTYYLVRALRGEEPTALDESMLLTMNSLYEYINAEVQRKAKSYQKSQIPCIDIQASGVFILGNFAQPIISPESFDIEGYPISTLIFKDWEKLDVKAVLTKIKRWSAYEQKHLEMRVNENLGQYLEEEYGIKASNLRRNMGFSVPDVDVDANSIIFPGGIYFAEFVADNKRSGKLIISLSIEDEWFAKPSYIPKIVDSLGMIPEEMVFELIKPIQPGSLIPGLETRGWIIHSQLSHKVVAKASTYMLTAEQSKITFKGFIPRELFGDESDKEKAEIASNVLALIVGNV